MMSKSIKFALAKAESEWENHLKSVKAELVEFQRSLWTLEEAKELERVRAARLESALEEKEMFIEQLQQAQQRSSQAAKMNGSGEHHPAEEFVAIDQKETAVVQASSWFSFCAGRRK